MRSMLMGVGLVLALAAVGDGPSHWVVGSFSSSINARVEAERLRRELGVPVTVTPSSPYRLLVDHDALAPATAESKIRAAGVADPWLLVDDGDSEATAGAGEPVWLKIAEVTDIQISIDIELELARVFSGVRSTSAMTNGTLVHRILLGPVRPADLERVRSRLRAAGYEDFQRIARPPDADARQVVEIREDSPAPAGSRAGGDRAGPRPAPASEASGSRDDFNFATLRRQPAPEPAP